MENEKEQYPSDKLQYSILIKNFEKSFKEGYVQLTDFRIINIDHLRSFWKWLVTSSLAIVGVILPFLATKSALTLFKSPNLTYLGVIILLLSSIIGILYLNHLLSRENINLEKKQIFLSNSNNEITKLLLDCVFRQKKFFY